MLPIFSFSNLAPFDSSDIEEVHQDFEMEKGGINRPSTWGYQHPDEFEDASHLLLLDVL
jgi:hypothetical protein